MGTCLGCRHDDQIVDAHVRWAGQHKGHSLGNVLGHKGVKSTVHRFSYFLVPFEPDLAEFRFCRSRANLTDPNSTVHEVDAHGL